MVWMVSECYLRCQSGWFDCGQHGLLHCAGHRVEEKGPEFCVVRLGCSYLREVDSSEITWHRDVWYWNAWEGFCCGVFRALDIADNRSELCKYAGVLILWQNTCQLWRTAQKSETSFSFQEMPEMLQVSVNCLNSSAEGNITFLGRFKWNNEHVIILHGLLCYGGLFDWCL